MEIQIQNDEQMQQQNTDQKQILKNKIGGKYEYI